jgi:hypothetical protein
MIKQRSSQMGKDKHATVKADTAQRVGQRWTPIVAKAGWTAIPNFVFQRAQAIGLDALDIVIVINIASYWWTENNLPFPSKKTIADAIGVTPRTVQKRIAALENAKLIRREPRRSANGANLSNRYHLSGLIAAVTPFAEELLETRAARQAEDAVRLARKGPKRKVETKTS